MFVLQCQYYLNHRVEDYAVSEVIMQEIVFERQKPVFTPSKPLVLSLYRDHPCHWAHEGEGEMHKDSVQWQLQLQRPTQKLFAALPAEGLWM